MFLRNMLVCACVCVKWGKVWVFDLGPLSVVTKSGREEEEGARERNKANGPLSKC